MSHLTDQQLVEHLYGEAAETPDAQTDHLQSCAECQSRLQNLEAVLRRLDAFEVPANANPPGPAVILRKLAESAETHRPAAPLPARRARWQIPPVLAASVLLMFTCLGFLGGTRFQSQRLDARLESLVDQAVRSQLQQVVLDRMPQRPDNGNSVEHPAPRSSDPDPSMLARLERNVSALASEQVRLRKDLETLAINAEAELLTTNRELRAATQVLGRLQQVAHTPW